MSLSKFAVIFAMYAQAEAGEPAPLPEVEVPPISERGIASWYGNGEWHGERTANGEDFDPYEYTCAHRTLPFDTVVLIENRHTGSRAWCRINDRGPYGLVQQSGEWTYTVSSSDEIEYRGILDMSIATVEMLGRRTRGLQRIYLRYWPKKAPTFNLAVWLP